MNRTAMIEAARRSGEDWVILEEGCSRSELGSDDRFRLEMHIPTGVAIRSAIVEDAAGLHYETRSYFINRDTGQPLTCGSREWNQGKFSSGAELERALEDARRDVVNRFAGMIRLYRRRRPDN